MSFIHNIWDFIVLLFWIFAFIAYLMAIFSIIGDLFRDDKLNGWWKALWIIFLIFFPLITALVYLIARGRGMAERSSRAVATSQAAAEDYIRSVASTGSATDEIAKAKALLENGSITAEEYDSLKKRILA